jgi:hypothetical protein
MNKITLPLLYDYVLPNMVMPNALMTEYALINFIQSRHALSTGINPLEQFVGFKDNTLGAFLFNEELGTFPNSLSGTHLTSHCYREHLTCLEDSVYYGVRRHVSYNKQPFSKYIYPIKCTPHIDKFIGQHAHGSKMNGEYFWKNISTEALDHVRQGNAIILIDYAEENFIEKSTYDAMHDALRYSKIPRDNIILAFNSFNAQQVYENWYPEEQRYLQVRNWPFVMTNTSHHYYANQNQAVEPEYFKNSKNTLRKNHFLFKIRRPRDHRLVLLTRLANDGLLDKGDWSCLSKVNYDESYLKFLTESYQLDFNAENIKKIYDATPHMLESESGSNYHAVSAWTDSHAEAYKNSYFYICTETYVHGEHKSLTEKVFKPIVNYQPFLFVAYPGALKMLRDLGFKTFDGFVDESYDNEIDTTTRINMIYDEIKKLCDMSIQELHDWYWSMEEILEHNRNHLLTIWNDETISFSFIKELVERTK